MDFFEKTLVVNRDENTRNDMSSSVSFNLEGIILNEAEKMKKILDDEFGVFVE